MNYKFLLFILFCFFIFYKVDAQNDFRAIASIESFKSRIAEESDSITSIESRFTQTKYIRLLSEKIISTGTFSYQKPDKVSLDYQSPVKYLIVINGNKIRIDSDGKTNTIDAGSNRIMEQMSSLI